MEIIRQTPDTVISELADARLTRLIATKVEAGDRFCFFYLEVDATWYRFFIEEGVLFWDTEDPDREEDLLDDEEYTDVLALVGVDEQRKIRRIEMRDAVLTVSFESEFEIQFHEDRDNGGTKLEM